MLLVDTHSHVNFQPFAKDYRAVLQRALDQEIFINNVGSQWESSQRTIAMAEEFSKGVWATIGLHPIHLSVDIVEEQMIDGVKQTIRARAEQFDYQRYKQLAQSSTKVIAIGECGLDYYHAGYLRQVQMDTLHQHCQLAIELNLPIVIHCRDAATHLADDTWPAFEDVLTVLRTYAGNLRGVIHCYTGIWRYIPLFLELGFYIGFTGIITFPNAKEVRTSLQAVPNNRLLLETDAPYLSPVPMRGKRNEPEFVRYVAEEAAKLKGVTFEQLAQQTTTNAVELFRIF